MSNSEKVNFKDAMDTMASFYSTIQRAGGSIDSFSFSDLEKMSDTDL